jgi:DNA (cytosine-5)-methyltransferase 1
VTHALRGEGFDASEDGTVRGTPLVPVLPFDTTQMTSAANRSQPRPGDPCHPLAAGAHAPAIAFKSGQSEAAGGTFVTEEFSPTLQGQNNGSTAVPSVMAAMQVRRLTVRECERLQGFEDDYTLVPYGRPSKAKLDADFLKYQLRGNPKHLKREDLDRLAADGPRYKALGNSWAVPNVRWIGRRINAVRAWAPTEPMGLLA